MKYKILYDNPNEDIITRILKIRWLNSDKGIFLNPTFSGCWIDPFLIDCMDQAIERIIYAIKKWEKIIVFGDYDVDGITSSYSLYFFINKILEYKNISIRLPNRLKDWYGIKDYHIDEIKSVGATLIITVDNGITSVDEAKYAKQLWIDMIITDHHSPLQDIPDAFSIINPKISSKYWFKELAGVWVVFKLISAMSTRLKLNEKTKENVMNNILPMVAIWTVADCVPLIKENRLLVKKWLKIINNKLKRPNNISNIMEFLKIKNLETYHIWFVLWPRLNAWWRLDTPYNSLSCLLNHDIQYQEKYLQIIDDLNTQRREKQEVVIQELEKQIDNEKKILIWAWENFHEWIIGIAAWRITEKYYKPSIVFSIDKKKWAAVASCRAPEYFSIIKLLEHLWKKKLLDRYWWHEQAWWLTIKLEKLDEVIKVANSYTEKLLKKMDCTKVDSIDTEIHEYDLKNDEINDIHMLEPFWIWNEKPLFILNNIRLKKINYMWAEWKHAKLFAQKWDVPLSLIKWSGSKEISKIKDKELISVTCTRKEDTYNWGYYFDIKNIIHD